MNRLIGFLDPKNDSATTNYNRQQAEIAVGAGGMFGRGYLSGTQTNLDFVPDQWTDFIFTVNGEEFGFVGSTVFLGLYALLIWRAIRIAQLSKDPFGTYLASGIATMFAIQMFVERRDGDRHHAHHRHPVTVRELRGIADAGELRRGRDPAERAHAPLQVTRGGHD